MKKIGYLILGALIGAAIGWFGCEFIWCVDDFLSCGESSIGEDHVLASTLIGAGIAGFIGFVIGAFADADESDRKKQQAENMATQQFQNWSNQLRYLYEHIEKLTQHFDTITFDPAEEYVKVHAHRASMLTDDSRYIESYETLSREHESNLFNLLYNTLAGTDPRYVNMTDAERLEDTIAAMANSLTHGTYYNQDIYNTNLPNCRALNILKCLKIIRRNDDVISRAYEEVKNATLTVVEQPLIYIKQNEYGDFNLPLDDEGEFRKTSQWIDTKGISTLTSFTKDVISGVDKALKLIGDGKLTEYIDVSCTMMWYYAKLKPFNTEKFNTAIDLFNRYSRVTQSLVKVEVMLAQIYAKNQLGGINLVQQDMKLIDEWIQNAHNRSSDELTIFASGLAWMELFEIEKYVLRKLVEYGVSLPADIQERLSFLESGGTANIKLYHITPSNDYMFDNSSLDWDNNDYSVFFRKLAMKKMQLNYSMAFSKWTKTLPLASGQKVSFESIVEEFKLLVSDFDGEVVTYTTTAKAVNLMNLEYKDAVIFKFTSERNRCIDMMFYCEKYGRNLNITIITMFSPDNTLTIDAAEKYCSAIKNNIYIDSFKESILQAVDAVVKERQSVYDDESFETKKKTIVE